MDSLLTRLEAASEGSREMDGLITIQERPGFYPSVAIAEKDAPHYTTSLDAKLPWENIVEMRYYIDPDGRDSAYTTIHEAEDGRLFEGKAKTEALARRIAALRARGQERKPAS